MANPYFTNFRTGGLLQDNIPTQSIAPTGILQEPMPNYDVNLQPFGDLAKNLAVSTYESASIPRNTLRDIFSGTPISREKMMGDVTQFGFDFGMLPALAVGAFANPSRSALMSAGGVDTVSGGSPRGFDVDELGFYSKALEEAKRLPQAKGTGEQFRQALLGRGVKQQELDFTPKLQGLLSQPQVTRDELVGLLQENRIRPELKMDFASEGQAERLNFGEPETLDIDRALGDRKLEDIANTLDYEMDEILEDFINRHGSDYTEEELKDISEDFLANGVRNLDGDVENKLYDLAEERVVANYEFDPQIEVFDPDTGYKIIGTNETGFSIIDDGGNFTGDHNINTINEAITQANYHAEESGLIGSGYGNTRFMDRTEDGGSNYREIKVTIPEYEGKKGSFVATGHFDDEDLIVHARTTDRNTETGMEDVLYVEELQSDYAQRGYKTGFDTPKDKAKFERLQAQIKPVQEKLNKAADEAEEFELEIYNKIAEKIGGKKMTKEQRSYSTFYQPMFSDTRADRALLDFLDADTPTQQQRQIASRANSKLLTSEDISQFFRGEKVETLNLDGKTFILDPDDFDGIDVTSKWISNDDRLRGARYELDQIDKGFRANMEIAPFVDDSKKTTELMIKRLIDQAVKENKDYVAFSPAEIQAQRWGETEGVKNLYEKTIPSVAKKIANKLDPEAKVENIFLDDVEGIGQNQNRERFSIEITPKMREAVQKGQPLFTAPTVPVPSTGLFADDPKDLEEYYSRGIF
jgi:hypothetical protein